MDPQRLLLRMCTRHEVGYEEGARLLPLVERALASPSHVRDRLLNLVDRNLARRAEEGHPSPERVSTDLDEEVLMSVSRVLHPWAPPKNAYDLGGILPEIFPGLDLE